MQTVRDQLSEWKSPYVIAWFALDYLTWVLCIFVLDPPFKVNQRPYGLYVEPSVISYTHIPLERAWLQDF